MCLWVWLRVMIASHIFSGDGSWVKSKVKGSYKIENSVPRKSQNFVIFVIFGVRGGRTFFWKIKMKTYRKLKLKPSKKKIRDQKIRLLFSTFFYIFPVFSRFFLHLYYKCLILSAFFHLITFLLFHSQYHYD